MQNNSAVDSSNWFTQNRTEQNRTFISI